MRSNEFADSDNAHYRYGSARFVEHEELKRAGFMDGGPDKVIAGFDRGKALRFGGQGGMVSCAAARSGKLTSAIAYTALGACWDHHAIYLDLKSEIAGISQLAVTLSERHGIYWSPVQLPGAPTNHRINPLDFIRWDSPSMVEDLQAFIENVLQKSEAKNGNFFEGQAKQILEKICIAIVFRDGVLTFPALYEAVTLLGAPSDKWLERVAFYMAQLENTQYDDVAEMEKYIDRAQADPTNETFQNFVGVLTNSFACLSSPRLRESLSPYPDGSFDFSFGDMVKDENLYSVFFCIPQDYMQAWGPIVRAMFVSSRVHKARSPSSRPVLAVIDEAGNTGGQFPLAVEAYTIGAGINYKPWCIFQTQEQMDSLTQGGKNKILSSAAVQQYFSVNDDPTAEALSRRIGAETLFYHDEHAQMRARHERQQALYDAMTGGDPVASAMKAKHFAEMEAAPQVQRRMLRNPDEIINTPRDKQYIFTDQVEGTIYCDKRHYFDQRWMAGRYLSNPTRSNPEYVSIKTRFGRQKRRVITEKVPEKFAHLPQYKNGYWSYVEGFRP